MIKYSLIFFAGVYIGQEYGNTLPKVSVYARGAYEKIKKTELYKTIKEDWSKNKN